MSPEISLFTVPTDTPFNHEYVLYDSFGKRVKIVCRKCDETIADEIPVTKSVDPETGFLETIVLFQFLDNYTIVQLLLTNNITLKSAMCKRCAARLTPEEVVKVYDSEILAIERDAVIHDRVEETAVIVDELQANSVVRRIG